MRLDVRPPRRLEHVQRPDDVRRDELARMPVRVRNRDQRTEVQHGVAAGERVGDGLGIRRGRR